MAGAPQGGAPQAPQTSPTQGGAPQTPQTLPTQGGAPMPQGQGFNPWLSQLSIPTPQAQPAQPPQGLPPGTNPAAGGMQQYIQQLIAQANQPPAYQGPGADIIAQLQANQAPQSPPEWQAAIQNAPRPQVPPDWQAAIQKASQAPEMDYESLLGRTRSQPMPSAPQAPQGLDKPAVLPPQMAANINRLMPQNGHSPWAMQKRPIPSGQRIAGNPTATEIGGQGLSRLPRDRSAPQ